MDAGLLTIARDCLECRSADWAYPLLRTFTEYSNRFADRVEISDFKSDQFRKPEPARIEELENRFVAARHPQGSLLSPLNLGRFFEQAFNLRDGQKSGEFFFRFWNVDGLENIGVQGLAKDQKLVEAAQRRKIQSNARARPARFHPLEKKGTKVVRGRVLPSDAGSEFPEGAQGMTIVRQGMRGGILLALEIGQELSREQVVRLGVTAP